MCINALDSSAKTSALHLARLNELMQLPVGFNFSRLVDIQPRVDARCKARQMVRFLPLLFVHTAPRRLRGLHLRKQATPLIGHSLG
jgi:hypothetical protein